MSAKRDGDSYLINGTKTFVTSGIMADLVIVAARTSPTSCSGFTLLAVERDTEGFERGRKLEKSGRWPDTAELFFDDVRVPMNRLGEEGHRYPYLMRNLPRERLSMAVSAVAAADVLAITLGYVKDRRAFGTPVGGLRGQPLRAR